MGTLYGTKNSPDLREALAGTGDLVTSLKRALSPLPKDLRCLAPQEIELKHYVPSDLGFAVSYGRAATHIEQYTLVKASVPHLVEKLGLHRRVANYEDLSSARVRLSVTPEGTHHHVLELKSPKFDRVARYEYAVPISDRVFLKLRDSLADGALRKLRYEVPGILLVDEGAGDEPVAVTLQLDQVLAAGPRLQALETPLFTADLEVSRSDFVIAVRRGSHSFSWLSECVELNSLAPHLAKPLSSRQIARRGVGARQQQALRNVEALCFAIE